MDLPKNKEKKVACEKDFAWRGTSSLLTSGINIFFCTKIC